MSARSPQHVTVLLGTRFAELERHGTRWRAVLRCWAADPRVAQLTVVDFPRFQPRLARVVEQDSWLAGVRCLQVTVPGRNAGSPADSVGWRLAARVLRRTLPPPEEHVVVAATPLWAPVVQHLPCRRRCFDAVDDWRALASMQQVRRRIERGYACLPEFDVVTAVSSTLADRLSAELGVAATTVPNGVDLARYGQRALAPDGLPDEPFAVYVGQVEQRVDLDLLAATARRVPVVVAGAATAEAAAVLRALPLTWLGPIDVDLVPGLLQRAHVGLLPHRIDPLTTSMDPMKLLEYLASGLPVVATDLPGVRVSPRVHVAADFGEQAHRLLQQPRRHAPDDAVRQRDWSVVADRLLALCAGPS